MSKMPTKSSKFDQIKHYIESQDFESVNGEKLIKDIINGNTNFTKISRYSISKFLNFLKQSKPLDDLIKKITGVDNTKFQTLFFIGELKYCKMCGKPSATEYCSVKCSNNDDDNKQRKKQTALKTLHERYGEGITSTSQVPSVRQKMNDNWNTDTEKAKQTKLKRYGNCNYNNSQKRKQTCLQKYGFEHPLQNSEVRQKVVNTNNAKYGCDYPLQNPDILSKTVQAVKQKYGVQCVLQNDDIKQRIEQTQLQKYGNSHFVNPDKTKQTKLERYGDPSYTNVEKRKQTITEKYGVTSCNYCHFSNFDLLNEQYVRDNFIKDGEFLVKEFMEFYNISPSGCKIYKNKFNITEPNRILHGRSHAEIELAKWLNNYTQVVTRSNLIKPYEIDILLPSIRLAIEYNGSFWHSSQMKDANYHLTKTEKCIEQQYQLFHIFDFDDIEIWKSIILNRLNLSKKIYARKCEIKTVDSEIAREFISANHLQGYSAASIRLGLYYDNELVQVMTFGKPRFNTNYDYELIRLCCLKGINVVGGASKLFNYFMKLYPGKSVISYCNRRFSQGGIYKILGFENIGTTKPNYYYVNARNFDVLSRYQCQKHKLAKLLQDFNPNLSEHDNMINNGYIKIYDCGNYVFAHV
mgnify:CR=1 FL=1